MRSLIRRYGWILLTLFLAGCAAGATPLASTTTPMSTVTPEAPAWTPAPTPTPAPAEPTATLTPQPPDPTQPLATATPQPAAAPTPEAEPITERRVEIPVVVPELDVSKHSVPLEEIYFDTFRPVNRSVPLSQAAPELIDRLRDAIPPIHDPNYETVDEANWLENQDIVIGYAVGDQAWAYPVRILNFHEIVNDTLDGEPLVITFCPLCYSGIAFSRRLGDEVLTFGNTSALYESDMVMLDYQTGSYWWQVAGQAIVGPLTEETLTVLPSMTTTWGKWRQLYPETLVLSRDTGFTRDYDRDPFVDYADVVNSGRFALPVSEAGQDGRLPPATQVLAVKVGEEARAYPVSKSERVAVMDTIGGRDIVVFSEPGGPTGAAYQPAAGDQSLTFEVQGGQFTDRETGSTWDLAGRATSGPLAGTQLAALPSKTTFWFAIIAAEPEITVYQDGAG